VIPFKYDRPLHFWKGVARANQNGKWGFIDITGYEILAPKYENVSGFHNGLARVRTKNNYMFGFVNREGKLVIPCIYQNAEKNFSEGLIPVQLKGKWGFIDKEGIVQIPMKYSWANGFKGGLAKVKSGSKIHYINHQGHTVQSHYTYWR